MHFHRRLTVETRGCNGRRPPRRRQWYGKVRTAASIRADAPAVAAALSPRRVSRRWNIQRRRCRGGIAGIAGREGRHAGDKPGTAYASASATAYSPSGYRVVAVVCSGVVVVRDGAIHALHSGGRILDELDGAVARGVAVPPLLAQDAAVHQRDEDEDGDGNDDGDGPLRQAAVGTAVGRRAAGPGPGVDGDGVGQRGLSLRSEDGDDGWHGSYGLDD